MLATPFNTKQIKINADYICINETVNNWDSYTIDVAIQILGDNCNYNASGVVLHVGGNYNQNQNYGAFYLNGNNAASNKNANIRGISLLIYPT